MLLAVGPAATVHATPAVAPIEDEVMQTDELLFEIDAARVDLELLERDLESGFLPGATPADFDDIDTLLSDLDDLEARAGEVTYGEFDDFYDDYTAFIVPLVDRAGLEPFPTAVAAPDGTATYRTTTPDEAISDDTTVDPQALDDSPAVIEVARHTAVLVFEEARLLLALDAFDDDTTGLQQLVAEFAVDSDVDREVLIARLREADALTGESLPILNSVKPRIGPATKSTVARFFEQDLDAIARGDGSPVGAGAYVSAIESLLFRTGRPIVAGAKTPTFEEFARELRAELMVLDTTSSIAVDETGAATAAATSVPADESRSPTVPTTPASAPSGPTLRWILIAVGGAAALAVIVWAILRLRRFRRNNRAERPGFHDLLDVSRRLASAGSADAVEEMSVQQAMRLTGANAGAFVRHSNRQLIAGYVSDDALLVVDRLGAGVLDQVVSAGQEMIQVSQTEPAIRNLPVSLIAAPVFASGAIVGALLVVRDANRPFGDDELRALTDLKPMVGAALESARHAERAQAEALADALTGVKNRRALDADIAARGDDAHFASVMVDLDHFKSVNDTFGHRAGDDLLRAAARRLAANIRPGDEVYRYGGEEFAIIMPDTDEATAAEIAERVRAAIAGASFTIGHDRVRHSATASFGVAAGTGGAAVIGRADAALYTAKQQGRDRVACAGIPA